MKRETVIRQNRCDREMSFLLFGCFFLFMGMQMFVGETQQSGLVNAVNMLLYMVFAPGFLMLLGYCFGRRLREGSRQEVRSWLVAAALRCYVIFLALALAQDLFCRKLPVNYSITSILALTDLPSVSAVFFSMVLTLALVWVFYDRVSDIAQYKKKTALLAAVCLLLSFLRAQGETYEVFASLFGSSVQNAVPAVPYFAFFLGGIWLERKKPAIQWQPLAACAVVTAVSLALYRTPLGNLCRVTASCLPVYLVYGISEYLTELTVRFRAPRFVVSSVDKCFWLYTALLCVAGWLGLLEGAGALRVLLYSAAAVVAVYLLLLASGAAAELYTAAASRFERMKHRTAAYFLIYTAVFALLLVLVFWPFLQHNKSFVWVGDGVTQYYPRALYFCRYIRELVSNFFHGNFTLPMYDFRNGFGTEVTYSLEPLYFLFALFGEDHIELAYNIVTLLRFYLSGIASSVLFLYFGRTYFSTFMGSVVYVFCGFALYGGAKHTMFMIPMIMLPLLILAIEEILRKKRWYLCTIFVAVSLFSNYYYLYMNTIAMGIYFLVRFFCQKDREQRTVRKFIGRGLVISGSYLLGVAMSCIVLVTTFGMYLGSGRSGDVRISTPSLFYYSAQRIVRCFLTFLTTANSPGDWLKLGYLPVALFAVVFLFLRKGHKELKILSAIAGVFMLLPLSGFVFSGFSAIVNRWCYMISLLVGYLVALFLPDMLRMKKRDKAVLGAVLGVYGYLTFFGDISITFSTRFTKFAFVFLAVTYVVLLLCQQNAARLQWGAKRLLLVLLTFALVFAQGYTEFELNGEVNEYVRRGRTERTISDTPLLAAKEIEDDSFYRLAVPKLDYLTSSSSLINDYHSVTAVNSTLNGNLLEYLEKMGCITYSVTQLMGLGNRAFLDSLAAVKYYAYYGKSQRPVPYGYTRLFRTEVNGRKTTVKKSDYAMPLGYTYDSAVSEEELESYSVEQRPEVMMQSVVLSEEDLEGSGMTGAESGSIDAAADTEHVIDGTESAAEEATESAIDGTESVAEQATERDADDAAAGVRITGRRLEISPYDLRRVELSDHAITADPDYVNHSLKYKFTGEPNAETYLVLKNAYLTDAAGESVILTVNSGGSSTQYTFRAEDYRYGSGQSDFVINLGYHEEPLTACKIKIQGSGTIHFDELAVYSQPMDNLEQYAAGLTEDILENVEIGTNEISGTVDLDQEKLLVLSIPYQKGWTAYVDGQETKLLRANYMYMGLPLTSGSHEIRLEFEIPGVYAALVIMASAFVLFLALLVGRAVRRRRAHHN